MAAVNPPLKAVARLLKPKQGSITHKGKDPFGKEALKNMPKNWLSFSRSNTWYLKGIKVRELIAYGRSPYLKSMGVNSVKK